MCGAEKKCLQEEEEDLGGIARYVSARVRVRVSVCAFLCARMSMHTKLQRHLRFDRDWKIYFRLQFEGRVLTFFRVGRNIIFGSVGSIECGAADVQML